MDRLACMQVFVCVVEKGSLSAAADVCQISPTMVGKHLRFLEERLGARLLNRTTRRQSLTEIGRTFYERCKYALAQVDAAEACASEMQQVPRGVLHVSAPVSFGANVLVKSLSDYLALYPEVSVELSLNDRVVDLVEDGIEAAIRIGSLADSSMVARRLMPYRMVVCASPQYLARHGTPATPEQLAGLNCMGFKYSAAQKRWAFIDDEGAREVAVSGNLRVNNGQALKTAALCGMGVIMQPEVLLEEDLAQGRLVRLLGNYALPSQPMHILYPSSRNITPKLKSFIDFTVQRFGAQQDPVQ